MQCNCKIIFPIFSKILFFSLGFYKHASKYKKYLQEGWICQAEEETGQSVISEAEADQADLEAEADCPDSVVRRPMAAAGRAEPAVFGSTVRRRPRRDIAGAGIGSHTTADVAVSAAVSR